MRLIFVFLITTITIYKYTLCYNQNVYRGAVTYELTGGRLGDQLLSYIHAKYFAYKHNLTLLYKPFPHSQLFKMHTNELMYNERERKNFKHIIHVTRLENHLTKKENALYIVPFFGETIDEPENKHRQGPLFFTDWYDQKFLYLLRQNISPRFDMPQVQGPPGYLKVLVHIRRASENDLLLSDEPGRIPKPGIIYVDVFFPLKFPPIAYYIEQTRRLYHFHNKQPLYVYIICDRDAKKISSHFKKELANLPIVIDQDRWNKSDPENPVFDFFLMMQFDCIIRSESHFSLVASKIGNFLTVVSPKGFHRANALAPVDAIWPCFTTRLTIKDARI